MDNIEHVPFSSIAEVNPHVSITHLTNDTPVSFIPMLDVTEAGQWVHHQERRLGDLLGHGYTPFQEGDVLFAKITPCMENGKGAHAIGLLNGVGFGTTEFHVLRAKPSNNDRFIYHLLQSDLLRLKAEALMTGSAGQRRVTPRFFDVYCIPSFSSPEQRCIASILDTIDEQIQHTERLIAKLKLQRAGLLHKMLTCGIDEHGQLRDHRAYPEQFKDTVMGTIPEEWEISTLGDTVLPNGGLIQTGPFGSQLHAHEYVPEGVPVIMPQDIIDGHISKSQIAYITSAKAGTLARHRVEFNDVVFARRGELNRCAFISKPEVGSICGTGCLLVRPPKWIIDGRWLAAIYRHHCSQQQIRAQAVGSTMVNLNTALLANLVIAAPSLVEQQAIVDHISIFDENISTEEAHRDKLKLYKNGLMHDLLTGKVRISGKQEKVES